MPVAWGATVAQPAQRFDVCAAKPPSRGANAKPLLRPVNCCARRDRRGRGLNYRTALRCLRPDVAAKLDMPAPLERGTVEARLQAVERQITSLRVDATRDGAKRLRDLLGQRDRLRAEANEGQGDG